MYTGMRVTQRSVALQALNGLETNQARLAVLQRQLSTGKQVSTPSDDPAGVATALQLGAESARNVQWGRNASDGLGWLGAIDSTLTSMSDQVRRVRDLVVQGASTGSGDPTTREAIATEVDGLRSALLSAANTTYQGRPVFGGTTTGTTAYDSATGAYVGDSHPVTRTVGPTTTVRVDVTGPEVFGPAGSDLFSVLSGISNDLRTNPAALGTDLLALDGVTKTMTTQMADVGVRYNRVDQAATTAAGRKDDVATTLSGIVDIDLARTITDLSVQKASYQAALGATAQVVQPSLLDYLK